MGENIGAIPAQTKIRAWTKPANTTVHQRRSCSHSGLALVMWKRYICISDILKHNRGPCDDFVKWISFHFGVLPWDPVSDELRPLISERPTERNAVFCLFAGWRGSHRIIHYVLHVGQTPGCLNANASHRDVYGWPHSCRLEFITGALCIFFSRQVWTTTQTMYF